MNDRKRAQCLYCRVLLGRNKSFCSKEHRDAYFVSKKQFSDAMDRAKKSIKDTPLSAIEINRAVGGPDQKLKNKKRVSINLRIDRDLFGKIEALRGMGGTVRNRSDVYNEILYDGMKRK